VQKRVANVQEGNNGLSLPVRAALFTTATGFG
jgi:hypothetical protein